MLEIEKKFRLTPEQRELVSERLREIGATFRGEEFEENTLYQGPALEIGNRVLRLRRVNKRAILTFKERLSGAGAIKHQIEEETEIADADAMHGILTRLGFRRILVYEKRRRTWVFENAEVVLDELPFGLFMEIEATEAEIHRLEELLDTTDIAVEHSTYPRMTMKCGAKREGIVEARFETAGVK